MRGPQAVTAARMLRILYGGTFDPVHHGHLGVARHARDALDAEVRLMPAADPPHKGPTHANAEQRAAMLHLAVADEPGLHVDLRELQRDGPSYTVDTLRGLRAEIGPSQPWAILIGADSFCSLDSWSRWRELFDLAHVVVATRAGSALEDLSGSVSEAVAGRWTQSPQELHGSAAGRVLVLDQPIFPQSASAIRRRISAGEPWRDWVPAAVAAYIDRHGLYR